MRSPAAALTATLLAAAGLLAGGCGEGEETFTAAEFVDRANASGAGLELREELVSTQGDVEIWSVSFTGGAAPPGQPGAADNASPGTGATGTDLGHGAGSLAVAADAEAGSAEFERCEAAASLVCFRAANVVVRLEGATPDEIARLESAVRAMESE